MFSNVQEMFITEMKVVMNLLWYKVIKFTSISRISVIESSIGSYFLAYSRHSYYKTYYSTNLTNNFNVLLLVYYLFIYFIIYFMFINISVLLKAYLFIMFSIKYLYLV